MWAQTKGPASVESHANIAIHFAHSMTAAFARPCANASDGSCISAQLFWKILEVSVRVAEILDAQAPAEITKIKKVNDK